VGLIIASLAITTIIALIFTIELNSRLFLVFSYQLFSVINCHLILFFNF
jgi:hypothetical protein